MRRAAVPAAFGLIAAILFLFAVGGLFAALFFWLEPLYGAPGAALITAAVAIMLGLLAIAAVAFKRRPQPAPVPDAMLPQFVSLMAQGSSNRSRRIAVAAVLVAIALGLLARGSSSDKK
jgi:branched-subunit amino acid ABC-type transport system permease component